MAALLIIIKARNIHERLATALYEKFAVHPKHDSKEHGKEAQTWSQSNRTGCQEIIIRSVYFCGKNKTIQIRSPHLVRKKRLYDRKNNKAPLGEKQAMKQTAALETKDPNSYIPIYSPKRLGRMGRQQGERTHYPNVSST